MPINTGFMYLGATKVIAESSSAFVIPAPTSIPFESEWAFDGNRNALNILIGQFVGRQIDKQSMSWDRIKKETWWALNNFRLENRNFFYCRYFDHNTGQWRTRKFYTGNPKVDPDRIDPSTGAPPSNYKNATLNFIDTGEGD